MIQVSIMLFTWSPDTFNLKPMSKSLIKEDIKLIISLTDKKFLLF